MSATRTRTPTCTWAGKSGAEYTYYVRELPVPLKAEQDGNYVYAKKNSKGRWVPVYIGEGDLRERSGPGHHKARCIRQRGATHFHCHLESDARTRRAEERDLLRRFTNAYTPYGCNENPGG